MKNQIRKQMFNKQKRLAQQLWNTIKQKLGFSRFQTNLNAKEENPPKVDLYKQLIKELAMDIEQTKARIAILQEWNKELEDLKTTQL